MTIKSAIDMTKTKPLNPEPPRNICPVCGEPSYSHAGIHPQCSAAQADAERVREAKIALKDVEAGDTNPSTDDHED
jgi:hypothetical protein